MVAPTQQGYQADLVDHHAECEANYYRVMQLLPQMGERKTAEFGVPGDVVRLQILEQTAFTTLLVVEQCTVMLEGLPLPRMEVRICHDASVAEVARCQGARIGKAVFDYPNEHMLARDEKRQINRFLGEWLSYCLRYGHSRVSASDLLET